MKVVALEVCFLALIKIVKWAAWPPSFKLIILILYFLVETFALVILALPCLRLIYLMHNCSVH